ncbi:hypothetical protein [Streptomyces sp. WM6378]|uniref:hypothetical protein n=1 Tax=Streptomyces sp. WM6378 TaxID=1415557 RepID=UPI002D21E21D|nr:hypothetical protein [Streptomyces sp. WM6378]
MSDHQRTEPAKTADDRTSLTAFLDHQRETLAWKCAGRVRGLPLRGRGLQLP